MRTLVLALEGLLEERGRGTVQPHVLWVPILFAWLRRSGLQGRL